MTLETVTVAPAAQIPGASITPPSIAPYQGTTAKLLQGHCGQPDYTILDGPTALWVPVVGCISSKSECCPTPMTSDTKPDAPLQTKSTGESQNKPNGNTGGRRAAFPVSALPKQGEITGCPQDYHTVTLSDGTACCPSSYWLWSTQVGGQVPCYSSLNKALVPPPMPDTLAYGEARTSVSGTNSRNVGISGTITPAPLSRPTASTNSKPTSAVVNIAFALRYDLAPKEEPALKSGAKIGIGVGAAAGGVMILVIIMIFIKRRTSRKRSKIGGYEEASVSQRFSSQVDMSRVAHEPAGVARTHGGVKYAGVSTKAVDP
ncbi:hypothetical protein CC86DRAFT_34327 [Ophiobolus disseminans]|uniref:Uncharacterized protein n=1 Tax=Ophiobolus disseminans TaxID=1469910 RepID=A0A6A6ZYF8_9PLEO|nr:hypothetical protein CC86DRAFT_34327 [Ophiobolus disseminans]